MNLSLSTDILGLSAFVFIVSLQLALAHRRKTYVGRLSGRIGLGATEDEDAAPKPSLMERLEAELRMTNFRIHARELVMLASALGLITVLTVNTVFQGLALAVLAGLVVALIFPGYFLKIGKARKRAEAESQLEQVLREMATHLTSGKNVYNTIIDVAEDMPEPLGPLFTNAVFDMKNKNVSPEDAMVQVGRSVDSDVFRLFISALRFQRKYGSELSDVLNDLADELKTQRSYRRDIKQETAQAKLSARIIGFTPLGVFVAMQALNPGYFHDYLATAGGKITTMVALAISYLGYVVVKRMCQID